MPTGCYHCVSAIALRLRPRLRRIRQAGLPLADIATLAQCPEAQFEKRLQGRLARA